MKKCFALLLVLVCLLTCACGKEETPAPQTQPTEAATEPETTAETVTQTAPVLPVVITKDPTDEVLSPGGKTWFVAHADNATSVSWEFLTPEGSICSVADTVALNPGLFLDVSGQDTIALEKIPLSLNGWSARARFDGPGGSATTAAARITVTRSEGVYDSVINTYREAAAAKGSDSYLGGYDVSEMIYYAAHIGYARKDLDGNGVDELIIAGIGYDIPEEPVVFEIFTIQNDVPVTVCRSQARSRMYLMNDGKIFNEGSSGAAHSNFSVMQLSGSTLRFLNGLYTTDTLPDGSPSPYTFYYTTSNQYGDPALFGGDNGMDDKVAMTFLDSWRASITLPELCFII